ncbi:MAG: DUF4149 domain-containing protein [Proteobacteria bacterium]|nr:DUF4149 domain-containing protein [Pseudomonadota bacterium]
MPAWLSPASLALLTAAFAFGAMAFFSAVLAPLVFRRLPRETAAAFMADAFPVYYLAVGLGAAVAAVAAAPSHPAEAGLAALVALGFALLRRLVLPRMRALAPRREAGEEAAARAFASLHRMSALVNLLQMLALAVVLIGLAA